MVKNKNLNKILSKELFRNIKQNIKQYVSIIAISFLAICLFAGLTSNAYNLEKRQNDLYEQTNFGDVYVTTTNLTSDDKAKISEISEITSLEERMYYTGNVVLKDSATYNNTKSTYLIAHKDVNPTISKPVIIQGSAGFMIMNTFAKTYNVKVNDEMEIEISNYILTMLPSILEKVNQQIKEELPNIPGLPEINITVDKIKEIFSKLVKDGKENVLFNDNVKLKFEVSGIMYHPEGVQSSKFSNTIVDTSFDIISSSFYSLIEENYDISSLEEYVDKNEIKSYITSGLGYLTNQYVIKTNSPQAVIDQVNSYYQSKEKNNLIIACKKESLVSYQALNQDVSQAMQLTYVFPIIFFLVSILIILTTLSQMIIKSRSQIGILKAIGVPKKSIYIHYISYGVILCFIGGLLGFIVGPLLIPQVMNVKYNMLWDLPSASPRFFHGITILVLTLLVLLAGICSFAVSYNVIKEKPVDTLRPKAIKPKKRVANKNSIYSKLTSIEFRMAIRNIFKNKVKTIMVILGMAGCTALMVSGFGIMDTLNYDVNLDMSINRHMDVVAVPNTFSDELLDKLNQDEDVLHAEKMTSYPVSLSYDSNFDTTMYVVTSSSSYIQVEYDKEGGISIDENSANKINVKLNDNLKVIINGNIYLRKVTSIFKSSIFHGIIDTYAYYESLNVKFEPTQYVINLKDNVNISTYAEKLNQTNEYKSVKTLDDYYKDANNLLSSIASMTNVVKTFAILLCIVVIYNLTSLNVAERTRDIATLKVLGFHFSEISKTLTYEIGLDSLIGSLIGTFLGYPLTVLIMAVNKTDLLTFIYHINWTTYLIGFLISFLTSLLVSIVLNFKAKKINMAESLKSVE